MAVYRRNYKPYAGPLTPGLVALVYSLSLFQTEPLPLKVLTGLFVVCFFYPVVCLLLIYLVHNVTFLEEIGIRNDVLAIDIKFFFNFMSVQGVFAFLFTAFAGPGLISPDLANGGLPLYFCRPFSRAEYVLGKSSVLAILLSEITWIPGLVLFAVQASLAGASWTWPNLWIAGSLVLSSLIWIAVLSLLAMALSAWVKWRIVAGALLLARYVFRRRLRAGHQRGAANAVRTFFQRRLSDDNGVEFAVPGGCRNMPFRRGGLDRTLVYCAICLGLLLRKVRAYEVVR